MSDILYAPDRERVVTTNAWAFLHWLRTTRGIDLPDWAALQRWSASDQAAFSAGDRRVRPAAGGAAAAGTACRAAGGAGAASRRWVETGVQPRPASPLSARSVPPAGDRDGATRVHAGRRGRAARPALARCPADPPSGRVAAARRPAAGRPAAGRRRGVALARRVAGRHHRHPRGRLARHTAGHRRRGACHRPRRPGAGARRGGVPARPPPPAPRRPADDHRHRRPALARRAAAASTPGSSPT